MSLVGVLAGQIESGFAQQVGRNYRSERGILRFQPLFDRLVRRPDHRLYGPESIVEIEADQAQLTEHGKPVKTGEQYSGC